MTKASSNPWRQRRGPVVREFLRQLSHVGAVIPRNEDIAMALRCDESTVRRVMGQMQDDGEIVVYQRGMARVVKMVGERI